MRAPIVLFVYNRPVHTKNTIEALLANDLSAESNLYLFSDGPKTHADKVKVDEVRKYIKTIRGFKSLSIEESISNKGLANSVIYGVTKIVSQFGKIIVLEDDILTSPHFLSYMNEGLEKYKSEKNVYSITGYSFSENLTNIDSTYFLKLISSWGWGTWADKWSCFKRNKDDLMNIIKDLSLKKSFNFGNSYDYIGLAKKQINNRTDSWAIYWYYSTFIMNGLTLYPAKRLVKNTGYDGGGTHSGKENQENSLVEFNYILTDEILEKVEIRASVESELRKRNKRSFLQKIIKRLKTML